MKEATAEDSENVTTRAENRDKNAPDGDILAHPDVNEPRLQEESQYIKSRRRGKSLFLIHNSNVACKPGRSSLLATASKFSSETRTAESKRSVRRPIAFEKHDEDFIADGGNVSNEESLSRLKVSMHRNKQ